MAIQTQQLERAFRYNSVDLPDPGSQFSVDQVRDLYSATYPEIVSAAIEGPEEKSGKLVYTFRRAVGTKGLNVIRLERPGDVWQWLVVHLPRTLQTQLISVGYGYVQVVYRRGHQRSIVQRLFEQIGDAVATVNGTTITLYQPEYFSDFEDLARAYEATHPGREVTLRFWESPAQQGACCG